MSETQSFGRYTAVRGKLAVDDARAAYVTGPTKEGRIAPLASFWSYEEAVRGARERGEAVLRFVVTNQGSGDLASLRVLTFASQGRHTFETREEAEAQMKLFEPSLREKILGDRADTLRVLEVECWPGHFDPKRSVFDPDEGAEHGT